MLLPDTLNEIDAFRNQLANMFPGNSYREIEAHEMPLTHHFADGVYVREVFLPKDIIVVGKRHRHETFNILLKGELSLYMGKGVPAIRVKAPMVFVSKPGARKIAYIHEDVVFMNVHPTNERDLDKIEEQFIIPEQTTIKEEDTKCLG